MIKALGDQEPEMRQKVKAYEIFKGNKPWEYDFVALAVFTRPRLSRRYMADYLEADSNPLRDGYVAAMQILFAKFGLPELDILTWIMICCCRGFPNLVLGCSQQNKP